MIRTPSSSSRADPVVLVHDYLLVMRGAERTFAAIAELYEAAPIFTLLYDELGTDGRFAGHPLMTSPLQRLGVGQSNFRRLLALYPWAVGRLSLPACEVVLSSSSAFAHGVRVPPGAVHVCYCYTPFRYAWYEEDRALEEVAPALRGLLRRELARIRRWDLAASRRVDSYVAISELSRERIKRYYGRDSIVIHPPVETARFKPGVPGESIDVVGSGPDGDALAASFPEARFLGRAEDERLAGLYASARAIVVPSMEEFGIVAVEAQAAGRPVVAAAAGGALETFVDGVTGLLAGLDDVESFARAIRSLDELDFDPQAAVA